MYQRMQKMKQMRKQGGFTMVELMVIVVVLMILGGVGYAAFNGAGDRARTASVLQGMKEQTSALERYRSDTGCFPRKLSSLFDKAKNTDADTYCGLDVTAKWQDPYTNMAPLDAANNIITDNFSPGSVMSIGQDTTSVASTTIYYVDVNGLPGDLVKRVVASCNNTDKAAALPADLSKTTCMGAVTAAGSGNVRMAFYRE